MIPATQFEDLPIRVGLGQFQVPTDSLLAYIKQCGVDDIQMNTATLPGDSRWEYEDLAALRERVNAAGLRLMSLENVPVTFYDQIMLGLPGRDEQIDHMVATVTNMFVGAGHYAFSPLDGWTPNGASRARERDNLCDVGSWRGALLYRR